MSVSLTKVYAPTTDDAALLAALDLGVELGVYVKVTNADELAAYFASLAD